MRPFYQKEWHGISFTSFTDTFTNKLADDEFYQVYYRKFFKKYNHFHELDKNWLMEKENVANWLVKDLPNFSNILSIGCGIGYIEQHIINRYGNNYDLHVQDFAQEACKWIREFVPEDNIHGSDFIDAQNPVKYDLVYLSAIAYALPDTELIDFLIKLKRFIKPTGKIVLVSSGFYENKSCFQSVLYNVKHALKVIFTSLQLRTILGLAAKSKRIQRYNGKLRIFKYTGWIYK
ncbi:N-terminal Xaa-Pro-Lys N-methyltransferase 1 [Gammaproteobacteria bacterium]|nr:N-terminal Xaa-Pro-Lys N-methyltransferase 1 [Gammaproteobacteria bacterium]